MKIDCQMDILHFTYHTIAIFTWFNTLHFKNHEKYNFLKNRSLCIFEKQKKKALLNAKYFQYSP